ncbi:hypothetical protein FHX34_103354 [Actinoplanes teichomyceticus]|uniref:Uncharacterized protein n=2 Tax=Actinoplanes teichomyceticus TaxID=1867 RepID=A0A561WAE0_ACTTI|nr:hypothetical protein FHX34_103354 [Actinoplanes teichomyceticus]
MWADNAYTGLTDSTRNDLDLTFKVVKKPPNQIGFKVLPRLLWNLVRQVRPAMTDRLSRESGLPARDYAARSEAEADVGDLCRSGVEVPIRRQGAVTRSTGEVAVADDVALAAGTDIAGRRAWW